MRVSLFASTYNTSQFGRRRRARSTHSATTTMPNSRKRKPSVAIQGPVAKQQRINSPIVISDDSDDDIRQISPPRLTAKQKGKGRASPETDDPSCRLHDIDIISIPDDEAPIFPTTSPHQTPLEVPDRLSSDSVRETSVEFEASSETLPPDQILEQFKGLFFGERKCSRCEKSIQPARSPVRSSPLVPFLLPTNSYRRYRRISRASQNHSTFSVQIVKSITVVGVCHPFSVSCHAASMSAIQPSVAPALVSLPSLRSLRYWIPIIYASCPTPRNASAVP